MRRPYLRVEKIFPLLLALKKDVPTLIKETGIPHTTVHRLINGKSGTLRPMSQLLEALGVTDAEQIGKLIEFREVEMKKKEVQP